jgi:glucose/arabinose dehydrogenase
MHQTQTLANRYATGIRNAVGVAISPMDGGLWVMQHGRDQLFDWRKQLGFADDSMGALKYNADNPAEELLKVNAGDDFGWPYCYYAVALKKLVLAPEYGGDGKTVGRCANKKEPVATLPGHWAPNGLMFYTGTALPAKYRDGAFIAFHGSWNRFPEPQAGYNVVFQPLKDGKAAGPFEVFADHFETNLSMPGLRPGATGNHRPTGLAQGPDGALYVADDTGGRVWKIVYTGR